MIKELRDVHGRRVRIEPVTRGKLVVLHQPTIETLRLAETYRAQANAQIYRVDLAYDFYCPDSNFNLGNFIRRNVVLKFRVRQPIHTVDQDGLAKSNVDRLITGPAGTMYWRYFSETTTFMNLVHYNDRPGKVDGGYPEHLELRITPSTNCRAAGFLTLHDVIAANPLVVFHRHIEIIDYDFERTFLPKIRRSLQRERKRHLVRANQSRRSIVDGLIDRFRARMKNAMWERLRRAELIAAQTAKRLIPSTVKKMSRHSPSIFNIPPTLTWGARPSESLKYQKKVD
jgi:hypothetical protein